MATSCQACKFSALRLFLSPLSPTRAARTQFRRPLLRDPIASLSTFRPTLALRQGPAIEERRSDEEAQQPNVDKGDILASEKNQEEPWYLQVEPPRHPTLIHEPAPLPEVPEGSPKLMEPLLKFTAEELGLDDLNLLDLRAINPPPALGPDLIMLFGTARSERHLHVSADRLVRWLRGRGVSADADGLLGRNELKIKLRRKARKMKLLGGAASALKDADDGISTGWVCVNLGTIGASTEESAIVDAGGNTIGFGVQHGGTTVVVQMFVQSRREALNLEKLWSGMLKRSLDKMDELKNPIQLVKELSAKSPPLRQPRGRRSFCTSARRPADAEAHNGTILQQLLAGQSQDAETAALVNEALTNDTDSKIYVLGQLKNYLARLSPEQIAAELTPAEDGKPSQFVRVFEHAVKNLPEQDKFNWRILLMDRARKAGVGHHFYDLETVHDLIRNVQLSRIPVQAKEWKMLFRIILEKPGDSNDLTREQCTLTMQIIDIMFFHGLPISRDPFMMVVILEAVVRSSARGPEADRLTISFEHLIKHAKICPAPAQILGLLDAYASQGRWAQFWDVWRIPPRYLRSRVPELYTYIFRRLAEDGDMARCREALRFCVPEMSREKPPVPATGLLAEALMQCIRVADPWAEDLARTVVPSDMASIKLANREFVRMFRDLGVGPA